ncbi:MAG: DUF7948 domain-containing protein [Desulfobaccales bacterium]
MRARSGGFSRFSMIILTLVMSLGLALSQSWAAAAPGVATPVSKAQVVENYGQMPLFFTENPGQIDSKVKYLARGKGQAVFFTPEGMILSLKRSPDKTKGQKVAAKPAVIQLHPEGMRPGVEIMATEPLEGKVNYYQGNDPAKWRANVPTFKSVLFREAYPGIDLKFYGSGQQMEYDLIVKPGADPKQVKFRYQGIKGLTVTKDGDLNLTLAGGGKLLQKKPVIYQEIAGQRVSREGKFRLMPDKRGYGFDLAAYDSRYPLIIDPVIFYSSYLGGNTWESANAIAVDKVGSAYVVGTTQSTNFPTLNPSQGTFAGVEDAFVTKFNPVGNGLVYSTYLGGSNDDIGLGIALDAFNNVYVVGETASTNFPIVGAPIQPTLNGVTNAFFTKFDAAGTMAYSTYLGGSKDASGVTGTGSDTGSAIAVDTAQIVYVAGTTISTDFPVTAAKAFQATPRASGAQNIFISKINPAIGGPPGLLYSTYLGGSVADTLGGLAIDPGSATPNVYLAGGTQSHDFPVTAATAFQTTNKGSINAFVTKLNPNVAGAAGLVYSTYLGGSVDPTTFAGGDDSATAGVAVDTTGNMYLAGYATSLNFPTQTPFQAALGGASATNAFVAKINPGLAGAASLIYSSYLGGGGSDIAWFIAVDSLGNAFLTGETSSTDFPILGSPFQKNLTGFPNAFVAQINNLGAKVYATYLGGTVADYGFGIAADTLKFESIYLAGFTFSTDFPTTPGAFQTTRQSALASGFVTKMRIKAFIPVVITYLLLLQ